MRVKAGRADMGRAGALANTPYQAGGFNRPHLELWAPSLASADREQSKPARDLIVARARDLVRNDGVAATAVTRAADMVVGYRWTLAAKPDADALGIDAATARVLARQMEREFRSWAEDPRRFCDRHRRLNFAGLLTLMARQWGGPESEALAIIGSKKRPGARYQTTLEVVDPDRLCNPFGKLDGANLRQGVALDEDGAPIGYWFRKAHPTDGFLAGTKAFDSIYIQGETSWGRPVVVHLYDVDRPGQSRGHSRFGPILEWFKALSQWTGAELSNAVMNSMFGAFVKTGADVAAIAEAFSTGEDADPWDLRAQFYENAPVVMSGLKVPVLAPGDEVQLNTSPRPTADFVAFRSAFLASLAGQLGLSYEQISMDFSKTNYSSARAALNEVWRQVTNKRSHLAAQVAFPIYFAVMEEAFLRGYLVEPPGAPPFAERPEAYCRAYWLGPGRSTVDPVKDLQADQMAIEMGVTTLEAACAERGVDYEDVLDQLAYEHQARLARGLAPVNPAIYGVIPATDDLPDADPAGPPTDAPAAPSARRARKRKPAAHHD